MKLKKLITKLLLMLVCNTLPLLSMERHEGKASLKTAHDKKQVMHTPLATQKRAPRQTTLMFTYNEDTMKLELLHRDNFNPICWWVIQSADKLQLESEN
jgi:hypothetical protein